MHIIAFKVGINHTLTHARILFLSICEEKQQQQQQHQQQRRHKTESILEFCFIPVRLKYRRQKKENEEKEPRRQTERMRRK